MQQSRRTETSPFVGAAALVLRPPLLLVAILLAGFAGSQAADAPSDAIVVTLDNALAQISREPQPAGKPLTLFLQREGGKWTEAWGYAAGFNVGLHLGEVVTSTAVGGSFKLKVRLEIESDNWVEGGTAEYEIRLTRASGALEGDYEGTFTTSGGKTWAAKDAARGNVLPPNPPRPGFVPVLPGEHPRCLFRKADLPALRERAKTPFGKAILAKLEATSDPVQLGFLYQLTGDRSYAGRAFPETVKVMNNRDAGAFAIGRFWGYRTGVVANAYDLCYDAWTARQRELVENYLDEILDLCLNRKHRVGTVNWAPGSNYTVVIHGGNGIAALALWGEKCPPPPEPIPAHTEMARLKPEPGWEPGKGVPIVPVPVGQTATEWIWAGPFDLHRSAGDDCLASIGGMAQARPELGQTVTFKDQVKEWKPLSTRETPEAFVTAADGPAGYGLKPGQRAIAFPRLITGGQKRLFFYNIIETDKPGIYRFKANFWNGACYLGGTRLVDGEPVFLEAGRYPWMVPVVVGSPSGHASPYFAEVTPEDAAAWFADPARLQAEEKARSNWGVSMERWKAAAGMNPTWLRNLRTLTAWNYLNLQRGMGDGGFQAEGEGYTLECHHIPHDFACIYQNVIGRQVSGRPDISHFAPRYIHDFLWEKNKPFQMSYGGHGGGTIPDYYLARAIALAPAAWKPVILDHWLKLDGVTREQVLSGEGVAQLVENHGNEDSLTPIWTFLNFPFDLEPRSPEGIIPRAWEAKGRGYYSFRNGWKSTDSDILASFYAKAGVACGWNQAEAGNFQIFGFGTQWAYHDPLAMGKVGSRWLDNVVMLPDDPINAGGRAKVAYSSLDQKTGGGVVTVDMDEIYKFTEAPPPKKDAPKPPAGATPMPAPAGEPIHGLRGFAADYSGKCGAPALFALVDKIVGGQRKIWVFQYPRDPAISVSINSNSFVLTKGDHSLKATFAGCPTIDITRASGTFTAHPNSGIQNVTGTAIHATSEEGRGGEFFVIFTLQRGPAPSVEAAGNGLDAKVTVGKRTLRFDGFKILLGER